MGREVKRVALDFDWPLSKVWKGFINNSFASNMWKETEPPEGPGWQMWETVSDGSPISPVFKTPEELARYMADNPWGASRGETYEQWLAMIKEGWAPSMVIAGGKFMSGVEFVSETTKEPKQ